MTIVNDVGRAQLQSELEPHRNDIDADDRVGADDSSRHDSRDANRSRTEDAMLFPFETFSEFITVPVPV